jgi:hypothetical protein
MTTAMGTMYGRNTGVATPSPSTADSTETAGVMMASPYSSAEPNRPIMTSQRPAPFTPARIGVSSAVSARMPPSPSLSARIMKITYLIVTMMMSAQKMHDSTPRTLGSATVRPYSSWKLSRKA